MGRPVGLKIEQNPFQNLTKGYDCHVNERFSTRFLQDFERSDPQAAMTESLLFHLLNANYREISLNAVIAMQKKDF